MNYSEISEISEIFKSNNLIKAVFTKKDGTERTLIGTIQNIPEEHKPLYEGTKIVNEETYRCFDVEVDVWRSFRVDSIISISTDV
jgi:hypothetical protein